MIMTYLCPKCGRYGIEWDSRAKVLLCYYDKCNHVIHIEHIKNKPTEKQIVLALVYDRIALRNNSELPSARAKQCDTCSKQSWCMNNYNEKLTCTAWESGQFNAGDAIILLETMRTNMTIRCRKDSDVMDPYAEVLNYLIRMIKKGM